MDNRQRGSRLDSPVPRQVLPLFRSPTRLRRMTGTIPPRCRQAVVPAYTNTPAGPHQRRRNGNVILDA
jgi:hypothetical protein